MITEPLAVIDRQLNPAMTFDVRAPAAQVGCQIVVKGCLGVSEQGCGGRCPTDKLMSILKPCVAQPKHTIQPRSVALLISVRYRIAVTIWWMVKKRKTNTSLDGWLRKKFKEGKTKDNRYWDPEVSSEVLLNYV